MTSSLRISPAFRVLAADIGDTTSVALVLDDAADVGAFEAELTFDPTVLQASEVELGSLLGVTGRNRYTLAPRIDNAEGVVRFGACTVGTEPGASGSGVLARVVFEVVNCDATTDIVIADATITNVEGWPQEIGGTTDGSMEVHCASSSAPVPSAARGLRLSVRPNPLSSATEITFDVPESGETVATRLEVFDASGRLVRALLHEKLSPGFHSVSWDARDGSGNALPAGTFFCRLRVGELTMQRRLVLAR